MNRIVATFVASSLLVAGCAAQTESDPALAYPVLSIPLGRFPHVADHARDAMAAGESSVCTIDRRGAAARRKVSLQGHPTAPGQDRDEFPPAMCKEGGKGADVRLVPATENRSEGAWMSSQLKPWPDGTRIRIAVVP